MTTFQKIWIDPEDWRVHIFQEMRENYSLKVRYPLEQFWTDVMSIFGSAVPIDLILKELYSRGALFIEWDDGDVDDLEQMFGSEIQPEEKILLVITETPGISTLGVVEKCSFSYETVIDTLRSLSTKKEIYSELSETPEGTEAQWYPKEEMKQ
ncbi:MAG: hypothetical protein AYK18_14940 [Theionarchaea archaeon DG-70]|nr:MAG: hypothetical protein AYK18_14940 [Theionarchaea archaeon DG-70]